MIELGMAIALGKPTFLFRDDFRSVADTDEYPLNLMLFTGCRRRSGVALLQVGGGDWVAGEGAGAVGEGVSLSFD